ncbi:unnamed protein product [Owenia fusiformis]|uniref:MOSC domain-containing protein n=1 Tax=Owenia fusiformis TaxID=6347 RepID=A0A8S4N3P6_OWEFU|nr:unnamed protein product [Owenia fusiformis]
MSSADSRTIVILAGLAGIKYAVMTFIAKKHKDNAKPVATIDEIYFYPFKALKGFMVNEIELTYTGFKYKGLYDRHFMIVNDCDEIVTSKEQPSLVLISTSIQNDRLWLHVDGMEDTSLPLDTQNLNRLCGKVRTVKNWFNYCKGIDCGDEIAAWFNKYLKKTNLRVIYFDKKFEIPFADGFSSWDGLLKNWDMSSYTDGSPVSLISHSSIDDLNTRLPKESKIRTVRQFRMNLIVKDCAPYAEDDWQEFYIGETKLHHCLVCPRYRLPDELVKRMYPKTCPDVKKLATFPKIGALCGVDTCGTIKVGDIVKV